jgi:phosphomannomutase
MTTHLRTSAAALKVASYLINHGKAGQWVVVGYDQRFQSENFAMAVTEVLTANDLQVYLTEKSLNTNHFLSCGYKPPVP